MMDVKEFYETSADFHRYVDEFRRAGRYTVEEALQRIIVRNVAEYYIAKSEGVVK